ncbi:MAG: ferrous iron transporter B [Phycisphaeraceae bacterium]|nr:ferrous iron transporter B [Phycisphaeraceae bacterium]
MSKSKLQPSEILDQIDELRQEVDEHFRDELVGEIYAQAHRVTQSTVKVLSKGPTWDQKLDWLLTHPIWGWPLMVLIFATVFWLTVTGANIPSAFLAGLLIEEGGLSSWGREYLNLDLPAGLSHSLYELLHMLFNGLHSPGWLTGLLLDGVYLCVAWVVSVMLPPMAIFFPLFTLLEDLGYLPRIAFNMDPMFKVTGAHGKQALTMAMGFGCNAAGVIACRIIDSPREKLIAIITNNFMICNGRFPTVIAIGAVLAATQAKGGFLGGSVAAFTVIAVVSLGVLLMFAVNYALSRTVLRGQSSTFTLELPPYRKPAILRIIYTSLIDRTLFVLARAVTVAAPAGVVIWLVANLSISGEPVGIYLVHLLNPLGWLMGLSGVILLAYIIAIPANEIVVPTIIMLIVLLSGTHGLELETGKMVETGTENLAKLLFAQGWTLQTCVCFLLFVLLHNPCGTTIWTIWKETHSLKWTALATLLPVAMGITICIIVANIWRLFS